MSDNEYDIQSEDEFETLIYESEENDEDVDEDIEDKKNNKDVNLNEEKETEYEEEEDILIEDVQVECKNQRMLPILNKYERVKLIGLRTVQLEYGVEPKIDWKKYKLSSAYEIAKKEFELGKLPFEIRRYINRNTYSDFKLKDLKKYN